MLQTRVFCVLALTGCLEAPTQLMDGATGSADGQFEPEAGRGDGNATRDMRLNDVGPFASDARQNDPDANAMADAFIKPDDGGASEVDAMVGCNPGATAPCGLVVGACEPGTLFCLNNREWSECQGVVGPTVQGCVGDDEDCDGAIDEGCNCRSGATRACGSSEGLCVVGDQRCVGGFWAACVGATDPQIENCDGSDNDCDGLVDEGMAPTPISCGLGVCAVNGQLVCGDGAWQSDCHPGSPAAERCNGIDDNCDGIVDNVASLGDACTLGRGECLGRGVFVCGGDAQPFCNAQTGAPQVEICDGRDNDCDGTVDNADNIGAACSTGVGACHTAGTFQCNGPGLPVCDAQASPPGVESCNNIDDDCDGAVDNVAKLGDGCSVGTGDCQASGHFLCQGAGAAVCSVRAGAPGPETCNGTDQDCDGRTDEGLALGNCEVGVGACLREGALNCVGGDEICSAVAGQPRVETCDYTDDDCDGVQDEGFNVLGSCRPGRCDFGWIECSNGNAVCRAKGECFPNGAGCICP